MDMPRCDTDLSFMTYTLPIREDFRKTLGAVTHVDGFEPYPNSVTKS